MGNAVEILDEPFESSRPDEPSGREERPTVRVPVAHESEIRIAVSRIPEFDEEKLVDDSWDDTIKPSSCPTHRPSARPTRPVPSGGMKRKLESMYSQILVRPDERKSRRKA
jgi:hypothetical protein